MKILIVSQIRAFEASTLREAAKSLEARFHELGHACEILNIPVNFSSAKDIPPLMLMSRTLELYNVDKVIALAFPSHLIRHYNKTVWLIDPLVPIPSTSPELRELLLNGATESLSECRKVFDLNQLPLPQTEIEWLETAKVLLQ
jgi:hypothetical protein